jgi:hypothetical protein
MVEEKNERPWGGSVWRSRRESEGGLPSCLRALLEAKTESNTDCGQRPFAPAPLFFFLLDLSLVFLCFFFFFGSISKLILSYILFFFALFF